MSKKDKKDKDKKPAAQAPEAKADESTKPVDGDKAALDVNDADVQSDAKIDVVEATPKVEAAPVVPAFKVVTPPANETDKEAQVRLTAEAAARAVVHRAKMLADPDLDLARELVAAYEGAKGRINARDAEDQAAARRGEHVTARNDQKDSEPDTLRLELKQAKRALNEFRDVALDVVCFARDEALEKIEADKAVAVA